MRLIRLTPAEKVSRETWNRMKHAESINVRLGEETLTDLLLLDMKSHERTYGIKLFQTTKIDEAKYGTDLEVVVRHGGSYARRYAIQAKKLYKDNDRYIYRYIKTSGNNQINVLEKYAKRRKAVPCYLLYNYTDSSPCSMGQSSTSFWHCVRCCDEPQLGCTLVPSWVIRKTICNRPAGRGFDFVHQHQSALPWRCLFDCPLTEYGGKRCNGMPDEFLNSFRTQPYYDYDWIPFEPVENTWPEQLLSEAEDPEDDFILRYCEWQGGENEYRPRRLLLIDPEARMPDFPRFYYYILEP